ncbi:expansin EXLX1 family cellulose-binding protein [Hyalangium versicolor]|uniref:expansin EXLX1 family cellulose-binding protein n=1 Tax=Hyalangium versicolor TaxID=2861190 RepID=UPI001CCA6B48|nr:expansin EXLX1 family cellulose-binding protein [Hyalangium versicolor]
MRIASDGTGNCGYDVSQEDLNVVALSPTDYAESSMCGACMEIEGPSGKKVLMRVVDSCSNCAVSQVGLTPQGLDAVGAGEMLQTDVTWQYVSCPVQGPIRYHIKDGSSEYWTAIQVRNHIIPITKLEYQRNGGWVTIKREQYNYFVEPSGLGKDPLRVRVTAQDGQTLEDTIQSAAWGGANFDGAAQFK